MEAQIQAAREKLAGLEERRRERVAVLDADLEAKRAKLDSELDRAAQCAGEEEADTSALSAELETAEKMRKHLNEYQRMVSMQAEVEKLTAQSEELTRKIELARELPGKILETATIPIKG